MKSNAAKGQDLPVITPETPAREIIRIGLDRSAGETGHACSFSIEDVVVIDLLRRFAPGVRIFALDTGRLPEETYEVAESVSRRYGIEIDWYFPQRDLVEKLERDKGLFSFRESIENRKECCAIRKVEPLDRALDGMDGWLTGMRRAQNVTRSDLQPIEHDGMHGGILKINPLAYWNEKMVWDYAEKHRLPVNRLHRQGYPSIGCAPCTRPIRSGEDARAGRWWWESAEHKECGLHR